ncbi:MAG: DivIVA domain-containing protein, partial [Eubacterium sp.]|nr:DivIVA domain-containing protein [Eubacterium sp.]
MLSPVELENKKMYAKGRKYHKLDVDEYLELVYANYKELFNENEELKKQIKTLTEGIQYYRSIESTMQKA